jgi:hypothetical protein
MSIIAVCSQNHTKHKNALCGQNVELLYVKVVVHMVLLALEGYISVIQTGQLMLYREIIAPFPYIRTKYTNSVCVGIR